VSHGIRSGTSTCNYPASAGCRFRRVDRAPNRRRWARESRTATPRSPADRCTRSWAPRWTTFSRCTSRRSGNAVPDPCGTGWRTGSTRPHIAADSCNKIRRGRWRRTTLRSCTDSENTKRILEQIAPASKRPQQ